MSWTAVDSESAELLYALRITKAILLCETEAGAEKVAASVFGEVGQFTVIKVTKPMIQEALAAGATHGWDGRAAVPLNQQESPS